MPMRTELEENEHESDEIYATGRKTNLSKLPYFFMSKVENIANQTENANED